MVEKGMERKEHREGVKHTQQQNNKHKGQNARGQQQINMAGGDSAVSVIVV